MQSTPWWCRAGHAPPSERRRSPARDVRQPSPELLLGLAPIGVADDGPFGLVETIAGALDGAFWIALYRLTEIRVVGPALHELLERLATHGKSSPRGGSRQRTHAAGVPSDTPQPVFDAVTHV